MAACRRVLQSGRVGTLPSAAAGALHSRALSTALAPEQGGKHVPFGEAGTGAYTSLTKGCFDVIDRCKAIAEVAVDRALASRRAQGTSGSTPFTIADFGTADGGTSLPLMRSLVAQVRAAEPAAPIVVAYEDQAQNDWVSLFHLTQGSLPAEVQPPTYLDGSVDNVYVLASGTSFYNMCLPPGSVDLAFSATAMHWLTKLPCAIPDALHQACSSDATALAAFAEQAATDWRAIMLMRAAELKPGGQMVVANFAKDAEGNFLGHTPGRVKQSMHHTFSELWLQVAGEAVHAATTFPNQYRSLEECAAPFAPTGGAAHAAGLRLLSAETAVVECPFHGEWLADGGDAAAAAARFVPTTRTWSNSTFVSGAEACGKSPAEAAAMADDMFSRYEARVAAAPADHAMDYTLSYLHIIKE